MDMVKQRIKYAIYWIKRRYFKPTFYVQGELPLLNQKLIKCNPVSFKNWLHIMKVKKGNRYIVTVHKRSSKVSRLKSDK